MRELQERLLRLAINDARAVARVLATGREGEPTEGLDPHVAALVRLGVLIAVDGPPSSFESATASALAKGATAEEMVGVLVAAGPIVGSAHVVSVAPRLARALGYDIDGELERLDASTT